MTCGGSIFLGRRDRMVVGLQLPVQSGPISASIVSLNPARVCK